MSIEPSSQSRGSQLGGRKTLGIIVGGGILTTPLGRSRCSIVVLSKAMYGLTGPGVRSRTGLRVPDGFGGRASGARMYSLRPRAAGTVRGRFRRFFPGLTTGTAQLSEKRVLAAFDSRDFHPPPFTKSPSALFFQILHPSW